MWKLNTSIIFGVIFIMDIMRGLDAARTLTRCPECFEENLSFKLGEPMDTCNQKFDLPNLDIHDTSLKILRNNFVKSFHVHSISLENNQINEISPWAFCSVPNLYCLNIRRNPIHHLFKHFLPAFRHKSVVKLNLAQTALNTFYIDKENLNIKKFPINGEKEQSPCLNMVTHLDISGNNLIELPKYLNSLFPNLTHLYMSDNRLDYNYFDRIPEKTEHLYLERNSIDISVTHFPKNITNLFLNKNNILDYKNFINFNNLVTLSMSECNNMHLIINYLHMEQLINLDVSSNNLYSLNNLSNIFSIATSLERLNFDRNNIKSVDFLRNVRTLVDLSLAYNELSSISSDSFGHMKKLMTLNLRGNKIGLISYNAFYDLFYLVKLDIAENALVGLHYTWMKELKNLKYLNLKSNLFNSIDNMCISTDVKLNNLFVGNNSFNTIETQVLSILSDGISIHLSSLNPCKCLK